MTEGENFVMGPEALVVFNSFQHHELYREAGSHTLSAYISLEVMLQGAGGDYSMHQQSAAGTGGVVWTSSGQTCSDLQGSQAEPGGAAPVIS